MLDSQTHSWKEKRSRYEGYCIKKPGWKVFQDLFCKKRNVIGSALSHHHRTQTVFLTIMSGLAIGFFLFAAISCSREWSNAKIAVWTHHLPSVTPPQIHHRYTPDRSQVVPPLASWLAGFVEQGASVPCSVWRWLALTSPYCFSAVLYQGPSNVAINTNAGERCVWKTWVLQTIQL